MKFSQYNIIFLLFSFIPLSSIYSQKFKIDSLQILNGSQSTGKILRSDATGNALWTNVSNGLSVSNDSIQIGGTLTKATTLTTSATNTLSISGLQSGTSTDSILVVNPSTGLISRVAPSRMLGASSSNIYTANGDVAPTATTARTVNFTNGGSLNFDANTLFIDATNNKIGIGDGAPTNTLTIWPGSSSGIGTGLRMASGASNGKILRSDATGNALWTNVSNGLSMSNDSIQIGGSLTKPTKITTSGTNTLSISGLQSGASTDSILVVNPSTGLISRVAPTRMLGASSSNIYTANGDVAPTAATARTVNFTNGGSLNFDANTLFVDATNNRVGIRTTAPREAFSVGANGHNFHIGGNISHYFNAYFSGSDKYGGYTTGNTFAGLIGFSPTTGSFSISNTSTSGAADANLTFSERLLILSNGNIGIRTTTPANSLEVWPASGINNTGLRLPSGAQSGKVLTSDATGNASWQDNASLVFQGTWNSAFASTLVSTSNTSMTHTGLSISLPPGKYYITAQVGLGVNAGIVVHPYLDISPNWNGSNTSNVKFVGNSYVISGATHIKNYTVIYDLSGATGNTVLYVNTYVGNNSGDVRVGMYADQFSLFAIKM